MPILRTAINNWVHVWNIHSIRPQKSRPHVIAGKPYMNYFHPENNNPDAKDFGVKPPRELLKKLLNEVEQYGTIHT